jgi:hypothetical protein
VVVIDVEPIRQRFSAVAPFLDERGRRLVAAAEAAESVLCPPISGARLEIRQGEPL